MKFLAALFLVASISGCSTGSMQAPTAASRRVASEQNLFWVEHPCGSTKGVPFRKYHSFALDEYAGVIYGRSSPTAAPVELKDKPKGAVAWGSVAEFLEQKGISAACGAGGGVQNPAPTNKPKPQPEEESEEGGNVKPQRGNFQPPVNFDLKLYYAYFTDADSPANAASGLQPDAPMKQKLLEFLSRPHVQAVGKPDLVVSKCPDVVDAGAVCVKQKVHDYKEARELMFGNADLRQNSDGSYEVFDHYCQEWKGQKEFSAVTSNPQDMPGPNHIVHVRLMNCEHTWPQSKFPAPKNSAENLVQKTDLHHIFSTDTKVNAERSNWELAEVNRTNAKAMACSDGRLGEAVALPKAEAKSGSKYFEPPTAFKGNIARALFYFSSRYNAGMSPLQEAYLRKWNREDPPDEMEKARHEKVYRLSGVRNPFIDTPTLADTVERFCRMRLTSGQAATEFDCQ